MSTFMRRIKNRDGSVDNFRITSDDLYFVNIGSNYKLVKFYKERKSFSDTLFGSDIGTSSKGFISVLLTASLIALASFITIILSFKI